MKLNFNTILVGALFPFVGFLGKELYKEVRITHDTVLVMKGQMGNYDVQISDIRTRLAQVEADIEKLKEVKK